MGEHFDKIYVANFDEAYPRLKRLARRRVLLLGNGFTQAAVGKSFSYSNLRKSINVGNLNVGQAIHQIFDYFGTDDFERIIQELLDADYIGSQYKLTAGQMKADAETLKNELIAAISTQHPDHPWDGITDKQYLRTKDFLKCFKELYSTNYDLLLYWAFLWGELTDQFKDGFKKENGLLIWEGAEQSVHYIHGGLHLFHLNWSSKAEVQQDVELNLFNVIKLSSKRDGEHLKDQIEQRLNKGIFPLTVAEGNWKAKLNKVGGHPYLRHCLKALSNNSHTVMTLGLSFGQDDHILKAIGDSPCKQVWVGVYNPSLPILKKLDADFSPIVESRKSKGRPLQISFYNTTSMPIW